MGERSKRHDFGSRLMREVTRWKVDEWLQQRAKWMIDEADVLPELIPKVRFVGENVTGPTVVFVGAGKGHEMEEVERVIPSAKLIGLDPHDHFAPPVESRLREVEADVAYLHETIRGQELEGIQDHSVDAVTLFFVLHHIEEGEHDKVMSELRRVLKNDGRVFVAEDIVDTSEEYAITERADRLINLELAQGPHHYRSVNDWLAYFEEHGFDVKRHHEVKPGKVRHGFFVLQPKSPIETGE